MVAQACNSIFCEAEKIVKIETSVGNLARPYLKIKVYKSWECSSVGKHFPSMCKVFGFVPSTATHSLPEGGGGVGTRL